jgi:hypothetical protein
LTIRCTLDGLLLHAELLPNAEGLVAYDGDESFTLEALEAMFYELVSASREEIVRLQQARYRLLRFADDFVTVED